MNCKFDIDDVFYTFDSSNISKCTVTGISRNQQNKELMYSYSAICVDFCGRVHEENRYDSVDYIYKNASTDLEVFTERFMQSVKENLGKWFNVVDNRERAKK
jgi:hypothetical protein